MEIKEQVITFITPQNIKIEVPFERLSEFCEKYVLEYASKSEHNKKQVEDFKKGYTYFKPYYDFLICILDFVSYPALIDNSCYAKRGTNNDRKSMVSMATIKDVNYESLRNKQTNSYILNANDINIGLNEEEKDGFFDSKGVFLTNSITCFHEETARILMSGICTENNFLINDLFDEMKKGAFLYEDYLCYKLGFIIAGSYRGEECMFVNTYLASLKQRRILEEYSELGYRIIEDVPNKYETDGAKEIAERYRGVKK